MSVCPYNSSYYLYGYLGVCIARCPDGYWGDPTSKKCLANCSSSSYPFKDNSTGLNICVAVCPAPNYFGETTNYYCVKICPDGYYGEITSYCVSKCASPNWGLIDENRKCVSFCPDSFWGEPTARICVNYTECNQFSLFRMRSIVREQLYTHLCNFCKLWARLLCWKYNFQLYAVLPFQHFRSSDYPILSESMWFSLF